MDKLTSLRRFYNNTYTDSEKQDAVNLFLGNYIPIPGQPPIWQLDSDSYLHSGNFTTLQMQSKQANSKVKDKTLNQGGEILETRTLRSSWQQGKC